MKSERILFLSTLCMCCAFIATGTTVFAQSAETGDVTNGVTNSEADASDLPSLSMFSAESKEVPPPPVISFLAASVKAAEVTLSWEGVPDITGSYVIVRGKQPVTTFSLSQAEVRGTVPSTVTTFSDTLPDGDEYYYAVYTVTADGSRYDFMLPASNSLLLPVRSQVPIKSVEPAVFSSFSAISKADSILVSWTSSSRYRDVLIYRSTMPFTSLSSLAQAILVARIEDTGMPYTDYPLAGLKYYYSILDEENVRTGSVRFSAGVNTNAVPVEISLNENSIQRMSLPVLRPMPLPYLNPWNDVKRPISKFSAATEAKIGLLTGQSGEVSSPSRIPRYIDDDLAFNLSGENAFLKTILDSTFLNGAWDKVLSEIDAFLAVRRTDKTIARARFYKGQAHYFMGNYEKALLEFLLSSDYYPLEGREWAGYSLEKMTLTNLSQ